MKLTSFATLLLLPLFAAADPRLAKAFTDHMVIQQNLPIAIWGHAAPGEEIAVELHTAKATTKAGDDGAWRVALPPLKADNIARTLTVRGATQTITLADVLLGEVWLCSGQSNMGRPIADADAKLADHPRLRLFNSSGETPRRDGVDLTTPWLVCTPASILSAGDGDAVKRRGFSEVAYHFGLRLHKTLDVPVGLMQVNCGGSTAQDWTPLPKVAETVVYDELIKKITHNPGLLYHVRLRGLVGFGVRGVVWYQGEDDGRNPKYGQDLKALIESWRTLWARPDLPFYMAQIAPTTYAGGMLKVWEGQQWVMNTVPHAALAPANDIYDGTNAKGFETRIDPKLNLPICGGSNPHPTGKPKIAARLADIALAQTYNRPMTKMIFGPTYDKHEVKDGKLLVLFKHVGQGLKTNDAAVPNWFEVAADGPKPAYVQATARIIAPETIELSAPGVPNPKHARLGWHTLARYNLTNGDDLPAIPFRTDAD